MSNVTEQPPVYVVDDEQAVRKSLARALKWRGFKVETFESAQLFLNNYNPGQPGCLVLDLGMPDMSGLELQQELNRRDIAIPIIFISGHAMAPQTADVLKPNAVCFLEKPFLTETLQQCIEDMRYQD